MPLVSKNFSDIITFTRASIGTYFDSAGVLQSAAINAPRFDYNPSTLAAQGFLIEEARTNSIRNNTMQGAAAGTPGTAPTNWSVGVNGSGLTIQLVGTGTENGINYIDYRFSGTTASAVEFFIQPEAGTAVSASNGQTWTGSFYVRAVAGSIANINYARAVTRGVNNLGVGLTVGAGADVKSSLNVGSISGLRAGATVTTADATTFAAQTYFACGHGSGVAIDITLRIGLPQLEQGAFATSVIPTTTTALTRSADVGNVNTLAPWYNSTAGTLYAEFLMGNLSANGTAAEFGDGTLNNRFNIEPQPGTSLRTWARVAVSGASQIDIPINNTLSLTVPTKAALAVEANNMNLAANGTAGTTDTTCSVPAVSKLQLGNINTGSGSALNGWLRRLTYYPRRLSNAELQAITA